jgi:hypothetical protein
LEEREISIELKTLYNIMSRLFFFLYNYYYKNGNPNPKMDPVPQVSLVMAIFITGCIVFVDHAFADFLKYKIDIFQHSVVAGAVGLICGGIIHSYYLDTNRIDAIYKKYKSSLTTKKIKQGTIFSLILIFVPYILIVVLVIIVHKV